MVLGGVGWDKKEFLESNLHVYGGDDTKIIGYNMERWLKEGGIRKTLEKKNLWEQSTEYCNYYDLSSGIELVLSPTLYKFIVWACWAKI